MQEARNSRSLPYLNNLPMILLVLSINAVFAILQPVWGLSHPNILVDAAICGMSTSWICVWVAHFRLRKLAREGALPAQTPQIGIAGRLPKSPWALSLCFGVMFAVITPLLTEALLRFFDITEYTFPRFLVWKLAYSGVLSAKLSELAVLRLTQPDCLRPEDPPQTGQSVVKNPLPKGDTFTKLFNTVTTDFGFNMLIGLLLGGTLVIDHNVIITPTTRSGILISGAILGAIVTIRMVYPVIKSIEQLKAAGQLPVAASINRVVAWLPKSPVGFSLVLLPVMMVLSPMVFFAVFHFFGFEILDFFQYFAIRSLYVWLLTKPIVSLAILRYMQPVKRARD